jgi:hypothetical protein
VTATRAHAGTPDLIEALSASRAAAQRQLAAERAVVCFGVGEKLDELAASIQSNAVGYVGRYFDWYATDRSLSGAPSKPVSMPAELGAAIRAWVKDEIELARAMERRGAAV